MAKEEDTLGSLFGKAKKWAKQEVKNATKFGGDPAENRRAREENEHLANQIESDAKLARDKAIVDAVTPQGIKDFQASQAANRTARENEYEERKRTERLARVTTSSVSMSGAVTGVAEGLAVETFTADDGALMVTVECVDAVPMAGGTLNGFLFAIPGYHGDGTYELVDSPEFDALQYELYLVEENEGWAFHPTYGPGTIVVTNGSADVQLTIGGAGSDLIRLHARIEL